MDYIYIPIKFVINLTTSIITSNIFIYIFIFWSILCYFLVKHIIKQTEKYRIVKPENEKFHAKYQTFRRLDGDKWGFLSFYLGAVFLSAPRIIGFIISTFICWFLCKVVCCFQEPTSRLSLFRRRVIAKIGSLTGAFHMFIFGVRWTVKESNFDYSPYLGKDYNKENISDKAITHICNHIGWVDILSFMGIEHAGFIARIEVKSYPLIGYIAQSLFSVFVDRHDKNDRNSVMNQLKERQKSKAEGTSENNLLVFPEGSSSNATTLLEFKRGAFLDRYYSVKPYVIILDPHSVSLAMDVIEMGYHFFFIISIPFHHYDLLSMPVFHPNDWMYKNSPFKGQDDWKVYADCVRDAMSKASGLPKATSVYEDKVQYLKILRSGEKLPTNEEMDKQELSEKDNKVETKKSK